MVVCNYWSDSSGNPYYLARQMMLRASSTPNSSTPLIPLAKALTLFSQFLGILSSKATLESISVASAISLLSKMDLLIIKR